jgi:hypothetical protein
MCHLAEWMESDSRFGSIIEVQKGSCEDASNDFNIKIKIIIKDVVHFSKNSKNNI